MNRHKIFLIIVLMGLSITGITIMQIHWMLKTIKLNEENFDRAVNETLTLVVDKLEKEKDIKFSVPFPYSHVYVSDNENLKDKIENGYISNERFFGFSRNSGRPIFRNYRRSSRDNRELEFGFENNDFNEYARNFETYYNDKEKAIDAQSKILDSIERNSINNVLKDPPSLAFTVDYTDTISRTVKVIQDDSVSRIIIISNGHIDTIKSPDLPRNLIPPPPPIPNEVENVQVRNRTSRVGVGRNSMRLKRYVDSANQYNVETKVIALNAKEVEEQTKKQQQALKQLVYEMDARKVDLKDRINFKELHHLLSQEFKNKGVLSDFEFALITKDTARKEVFSTPQFNKLSSKSIYSTRLFPNNFVPLNDFLEVAFPDKDTAIYKSVILPISASLFFTLIVFLTFTITLVTIIKQKKLAEMKADFINNMTHELKTPIATISLASDSIDNPKVVEKPETVKYFTAIIREENSRMNKLVESVLQTARLERKTLKINLKEVNLSNLTAKVADQMAIQAEAKGGKIVFNRPEGDLNIIADENLMENVIFNLVDNAIKYSSSSPKVVVALKKLPGGISLSVQDNGIGMSRGEQQRVFEKFYRVSQGDVHNIKGFGLGLSNVKEITELHGGIVQLRSELGKGSTFTLFFPNNVNGNE